MYRLLHLYVSVCLHSKVYSVKMCILKLFALAVLMNSVKCLDWDLSLKIGSDDNYQRPPHKAMNDYASFQEISDLAREIFDNLEQLKVLESQKENNEKHDRILQCLIIASVIIGHWDYFSCWRKYRDWPINQKYRLCPEAVAKMWYKWPIQRWRVKAILAMLHFEKPKNVYSCFNFKAKNICLYF